MQQQQSKVYVKPKFFPYYMQQKILTEMEIKIQQQDHFPTSIEPLRTIITQNNPLTIKNKLINFKNLSIIEKNFTVSDLPIMLDQLGQAGISILNDLITTIEMQQENTISNGLVYKIPELLTYIQKHQNCDTNIKSILIPSIIKFLNSNDIEVLIYLTRIKQLAGNQLGMIATKLNEKDRGEFVLTHVLLMAHDDLHQNNRVIAVQLLNNLSECLGMQLCQQFVGLELLSLGNDGSELVKKQVIKNLATISKMVSQDFFEQRILPFFYQKVDDRKNWELRKTCADIIIQITELSPQKQRQNNLTNIMIKLTKDNNKWVKLSAYKNLGKFIYCMKGLKVHEKLFKRFLKMPEGQIAALGEQIPYQCAFHFPAVVSVLGLERWPQLNKTYSKLLSSHDKRIQITLSQSLYQIAKIIGAEYTQKYLFPIIDKFMMEDSDDVRLGILKNMSQIIFVLSDDKRQKMLLIFQQFQKDHIKWRIRSSIAKQLPILLQMYQIEIIFTYMVPVLLRLCSDPVSIVREEASHSIPNFISTLNQIETLKLGFIQSMKGFANSTSFVQRIQFINFCRQTISRNKNQFLQYLFQLLINLKTDKVINVRISLALFVNEYHQYCSLNKQNKAKDQIQLQIHKKMQNLYQQYLENVEDEIKQIFDRVL